MQAAHSTAYFRSKVDGTLTVQQSVLRVQPLADASRRERVGQQEGDLANLDEPVVPVLLDPSPPPLTDGPVGDACDRTDFLLS